MWLTDECWIFKLSPDKDLKDQLMKAYKSEAAELKERSLRSRGTNKLTLSLL